MRCPPRLEHVREQRQARSRYDLVSSSFSLDLDGSERLYKKNMVLLFDIGIPKQRIFFGKNIKSELFEVRYMAKAPESMIKTRP